MLDVDEPIDERAWTRTRPCQDGASPMDPHIPNIHTREGECAQELVLTGVYEHDRGYIWGRPHANFAGIDGEYDVVARLFSRESDADRYRIGFDIGEHTLDQFENVQRRLNNLRSLVDRFGIEPPGGDGPRVA